MMKLSTGLPGLLESPFFWLLLILPATASVLAFQYVEQARAIPPATSGTSVAVRHPAVTAAAGVRPGSTASPQPRARPVSAELPARRTPAVVHNAARDGNRMATDSEAQTVPSSLPYGAEVPATVHDPANGRSDLLITATSATPATPATAADTSTATASTAGTDKALDDNPWLPDASSDNNDNSTAQAATVPDCPRVLFRGGNAYARLRLELMGCPIPGS